jgi:hypothetical protein
MNEYQLLTNSLKAHETDSVTELLMANGHTHKSANEWLANHTLTVEDKYVVFISALDDSWKYRIPHTVEISIVHSDHYTKIRIHYSYYKSELGELIQANEVMQYWAQFSIPRVITRTQYIWS